MTDCSTRVAHATEPSTTTPRVEVIEPGLVVLRQFVADGECRAIAEMATSWGDEGEDGFYTETESGGKILNTGESRGRIYDAISRFPPSLVQHCNKAVDSACRADCQMPEMTCSHLLLNMYTTQQGLVWHRDIYENDGKSDHPVVNLCIGASCVFAFKHNDNDEERKVVLRSGDVILFGGPCRLIQHAVLEVLLDDCPGWMENSCRFSFTFRDSPEVIGREHEFKYFRVREHLVGQENFQVPVDLKEFKGLPSRESQFSATQRLNRGASDYEESRSDKETFCDVMSIESRCSVPPQLIPLEESSSSGSSLCESEPDSEWLLPTVSTFEAGDL